MVFVEFAYCALCTATQIQQKHLGTICPNITRVYSFFSLFLILWISQANSNRKHLTLSPIFAYIIRISVWLSLLCCHKASDPNGLLLQQKALDCPELYCNIHLDTVLSSNIYVNLEWSTMRKRQSLTNVLCLLCSNFINICICKAINTFAVIFFFLFFLSVATIKIWLHKFQPNVEMKLILMLF